MDEVWHLRETGWRSVEWIQLAQDRDRWWALVNTAEFIHGNSVNFLQYHGLI
jgi:hypothetical protein